MKVKNVKQIGNTKFEVTMEITIPETEYLEDLATADLAWLEDNEPSEYKQLMDWFLKFWLKLVRPIDKIYYKKVKI